MEVLRRIIRRIFTKTLYLRISEYIDWNYVLFTEGRQTLRTLNSNGEAIKKIALKKLKHPFFFRPGTRDRDVIIQSIIRKEYDRKINANIGNGFIIDAGAYIGDLSCYFASKYNCKIISLESNNESYNIAAKNTSLYPKIFLLNKGLWYKETKLIVRGDSTGSKVIEANDDHFDIDGISLEKLIDDYNIKLIEILKLDIEGAEEKIFSKDISGWINIVKIILVEIHTKTGKELILNKLKSNNFIIERYRSIYYCINKSLIKPSSG